MIEIKLDLENKPVLSEEQIKRLNEVANMPDEQIDYSDIPPLTPEQIEAIKRVSTATNTPDENFTERLF
jgi:hypothetical protein